MRSGRADLGVGVFDVVPRGLSRRRLCTAPTCVAIPRGHRLAGKKRIVLADLSGERLILAPEGQKHRDIVGGRSRRRGRS